MDLNRFNIAVIGAGALGGAVSKRIAEHSPASLRIIDGDIVSEKNLTNQPLFSKEDVVSGTNKAVALSAHLRKYSNCKIEAFPFYVGESRIISIVADADLVIDATDNESTRLVINDACIKTETPLLIASVKGNKGFLYLINGTGACYNCIHRNLPTVLEQGCSSVSYQSADALGKKMYETVEAFLLQGINRPFLVVDTSTGKMVSVPMLKDSSCEACSQHRFVHRLDDGFIQLCGEGIKFSAQKDIDLDKLSESLGHILYNTNGMLRAGDAAKSVTVSREGDFLFYGYTLKEAKELITHALGA